MSILWESYEGQWVTYEKGMSIMTKTQAIEYIMQKNNVSYVVAKVYVETVLGL